MPYDNVISRQDAAALIPEEVSAEIIQGLPQASAAMALFRQVRMSAAQQRLPVMAALPVAYFVNGDTGLKQTTEAGWDNRYLNVEEIACIAPVPENVLADSSFDIWGQVRPWIEAAVGQALDAAIFFGTNKPATWPTAIAVAAETAGNVATRGTATPDAGGVAGDVSALFATVEDDGFDVNGVIAHRRYRGFWRDARDTSGNQLADVGGNSIYGVPVAYPMRGLWPVGAGAAEMIAGDFTEGILGVRQDITFKMLDQAVIQDNTGQIIYNLAQQDMVAARVTARFAFELRMTPQPENAANPYPFGVMKGA